MITLYEKETKELDFVQLDKAHFKFLANEFKEYNFKSSGGPNKMQYLTVLLNYTTNKKH